MLPANCALVTVPVSAVVATPVIVTAPLGPTLKLVLLKEARPAIADVARAVSSKAATVEPPVLCPIQSFLPWLFHPNSPSASWLVVGFFDSL